MKKRSDSDISCPNCHATFVVRKGLADKLPLFCTYCGSKLDASRIKTMETETGDMTSLASMSTVEGVALVTGEVPQAESVQFTIGPYQVLGDIGKGGMGEVFMAFDTNCGRRIALKRIRSDLTEHVQMHNRFLKEARITAQLTHPSIIPIYAIQAQDHQSYYTMPYVEGETLKQILRMARLREKQGEKADDIGGAIPALVRIFLNICQAIAYAHSKWVLHRDIKPENIIVGKYGEVLILDWGLAKLIHPAKASPDEEGEEIPPHPLHHLTMVGKVVGTVSYMAPERAMGNPATFQTDIYSLGVILYQILTLRHPFKRGTLQQFRENMHLEVLRDPSEVAPYREVPRVLSRIVLKCLDPDLEKRYRTMDELIDDLKNYIEGRAEWFQIATLDLKNKSDWEFQENVLIAEHIAITRSTEVADWVNLMVSKASFSANIKLEAKVRIGEKSHGLGFLLCIPEAAERRHLNDGYCLWMGTASNKSTKLLRSTVEVMHTPDACLIPGTWHHLCIEKVENHIHVYLDNALQMSYISYFPLMGTHVGLLARDADFEIEHFSISVGSQSVMVNCLAVPDAFLAQKDYATALSEYRRIGYSFPGRAEGREAMFRAGITLLEQARNTPDPTSSHELRSLELFDLSLQEFEKLRNTPGAPLEYLGKALVYQEQQDYEEEIKCFELAFRRYRRHPLLRVLQEQQLFRMYSSSHHHRQAAYSFILLALRHLPEVAVGSNAKKLFTSLKKHWEPLFFIENDPACAESDPLSNYILAITLAFWLAKPYVLAEIADELLKRCESCEITLGNALYCLIELGAWQLAELKLPEIPSQGEGRRFALLRALILNEKGQEKEAEELLLSSIKGATDRSSERAILAFLRRALLKGHPQQVEKLYSTLQSLDGMSQEATLLIDSYRIWAFLAEKKWEPAGDLLHRYSIEELSQENSPLHFLYGCWLLANEGREIAAIHMGAILELPYPSSWALCSHYFFGRVSAPEWSQKAFLWEKRQLHMQLALYYACMGEEEKSLEQKALEQKEYVHVEL